MGVNREVESMHALVTALSDAAFQRSANPLYEQAAVALQTLLDEKKAREGKVERVTSILNAVQVALARLVGLLGISADFAEPARRDGKWRRLLHVSEDGRVVSDEYPGEVHEYIDRWEGGP